LKKKNKTVWVYISILPNQTREKGRDNKRKDIFMIAVTLKRRSYEKWKIS